jgi:hypothetical protein
MLPCWSLTADAKLRVAVRLENPRGVVIFHLVLFCRGRLRLRLRQCLIPGRTVKDRLGPVAADRQAYKPVSWAHAYLLADVR